MPICSVRRCFGYFWELLGHAGAFLPARSCLGAKWSFWAPMDAEKAPKWINGYEMYAGQTCEVFGGSLDDPGAHLSVIGIFSQCSPILSNLQVVT